MAGEFDYLDPYPAGTMTAIGMQQDNPLMDWGSNVRPSELQMFLHDPEKFKDMMAAKGIAPPQALPFAGDTSPELKPEEKGTVLDVPKVINRNVEEFNKAKPPPPQTKPLIEQAPATVPGVVRDPSQGNLTDDLNKPPTPMKRPDETGGGYFDRFGNWVSDWMKERTAKPATPPAPTSPGVQNVLPEKTIGPAPGTPGPYTAGNETPAEKDLTMQEDVAKKEREKKLSALSDFAKSLQGIKMPTPPTLAPPHGLAVRSPNAVPQTAMNLLQLVGQHPGPQMNLLRLLGRA